MTPEQFSELATRWLWAIFPIAVVAWIVGSFVRDIWEDLRPRKKGDE